MTHSCRFCGAALSRSVANLGFTPLANTYLTPTQMLDGEERSFPLHARVCDSCLLVQVEDSVSASEIFSDYAYFSSFSSSWIEHANTYAAAMVTRFGLDSRSKVVEVASNDGYLLRHFADAGVPVLGVEPAANVAAVAVANGVATEVAFFGADAAISIATRHGHADLVVANNVLAHVPDLHTFIAGFQTILKPDGVATFEFPHLMRLIQHAQFDTIYHEHFSYLSLLVVERLLSTAGLRAFDVDELPTHGGSLRVYCCKNESATHSPQHGLAEIRAAERDAGLDRVEGYDSLAPRIATSLRTFRKFLNQARRERRLVAAYGAAAKGNTFLNACAVKPSDIACVADRNPAKQGRLLPGSHLPVVTPQQLAEFRPDDVVILPWNIASEIADELRATCGAAPRLWVAMPELRQL